MNLNKMRCFTISCRKMKNTLKTMLKNKISMGSSLKWKPKINPELICSKRKKFKTELNILKGSLRKFPSKLKKSFILKNVPLNSMIIMPHI